MKTEDLNKLLQMDSVKDRAFPLKNNVDIWEIHLPLWYTDGDQVCVYLKDNRDGTMLIHEEDSRMRWTEEEMPPENILVFLCKEHGIEYHGRVLEQTVQISDFLSDKVMIFGAILLTIDTLKEYNSPYRKENDG